MKWMDTTNIKAFEMDEKNIPVLVPLYLNYSKLFKFLSSFGISDCLLRGGPGYYVFILISGLYCCLVGILGI